MELLHKGRNLEHIKLAAVFVGLNIVDIVLTQIMINNGGYELNPIMRYLLGQFGWAAWAIKLAAVAIAMFVLLWRATKYPRLAKIVFISLIIFMLVNCLFNGIGLIRLL